MHGEHCLASAVHFLPGAKILRTPPQPRPSPSRVSLYCHWPHKSAVNPATAGVSYSSLFSSLSPTSPFCQDLSILSQSDAPASSCHFPGPISHLLPSQLSLDHQITIGASRSWSCFTFCFNPVCSQLSERLSEAHPFALLIWKHLWLKELSKKKANNLTQNTQNTRRTWTSKSQEKNQCKWSIDFRKRILLPYNWKDAKQNNAV